MTKVKVVLVLLCAAGVLVWAQEAEKKQGGGILHPEMKLAADAGTYEAPMGKLGEKPSEPWSSTTIEAAVDKKANPGRIETVVGEIVDFSCYMQLGKHGEAHKACGTKCLANGQPIGLVTKDGLVYVLMEEEHHPRRDSQTTLREEAAKHLGHIMEVTGTATRVAGQRALFVSGLVKK